MEVKLLSEIYKIKKLMNLELNNNLLIFEQDTAYERYLNRRDSQTLENIKTEPGVFEDWKTIEIGNETKYPVMLAGYKVPVVYNPVRGNPDTYINQFKGEEDFEKYFASAGLAVKTFVVGDKLDNGSAAPVGRKYIIRDNKKYCLPDSNWTKLHTDKNYVYSFTNPKTLKTFSVILQFAKQTFVNGQSLKGDEASRQCIKGSSGWEFLMTLDPPEVFFEKKTKFGNEPFKLESYDLKEDANPNSRFDDWWDSGWGIAIELAIGLAAGFLTGGVTTALLAAARAGSLGVRLGSVIIALGETAYFGGSVSLLTPIVGSLIEAGLMIPSTIYGLERGRTDEAILGLVFCFLPFFMEVPGISRLFKTGKWSLTDGEKLGKEIILQLDSAGGYKAVVASQTTTANFLAKLSPEGQVVFLKTMKELADPKNAPKFESGIKLLLKQNSDTIVEQMSKPTKKYAEVFWNGEPGEATQRTAKAIWENANIVTGKGILAQFIRTGVPIAGVSIGFLKCYNTLINIGMSDKSAQELTKQYKEAIEKNEYVKSLISLQETLGYGPQMIQEQVDYMFFEGVKNNPDKINKIIESDVVEEKIIEPMLAEEIEKQKEVMTDVYKETVSERLIPIAEKLQQIQVLKDIVKITTLTEPQVLQELINKVVPFGSWTDTNNQTLWTFQTEKKENGEVSFNTPPNNWTIIKINGVELIDLITQTK